MATPRELEQKFWKALKSDMTLMLGLDGVEDGHARPMTAQIEGEHGPIWFFTARDNALVQKLSRGDRAIAAARAHIVDGCRAAPPTLDCPWRRRSLPAAGTALSAIGAGRRRRCQDLRRPNRRYGRSGG